MNIDFWQMSHSFPLAACGSEERDMSGDLQLHLPNARPRPVQGTKSPAPLSVCPYASREHAHDSKQWRVRLP